MFPGEKPQLHQSSEETESSRQEGIETQSTNSNQLSVHSIHSKLSLPGAGVTGLGCKIDFRITGYVLGVAKWGGVQSPHPRPPSKCLPFKVLRCLTLIESQGWQRLLFCYAPSGSPSSYQINFFATIIINIMFSLFSSGYT